MSLRSPWELGLTAGRDCATGDQEAYTRFDDIKSRHAYVLPGLPEQYREFHQRRCANSFAATGQYDFDIWSLSVIASSQRVQSTRRWPLDAYFPQFQEHWKQNTPRRYGWQRTRPRPAPRTSGMLCSASTARKWIFPAAINSTW